MPVEFAVVKRAPVAEQILIVGNLIGAATVQVVPRVNGRLATVNVQLGDSVRRGQTVAKVEDLEIQEQVRQAAGGVQGVGSHDPAARGRPQARDHQPRPVEEPLRPAAAAAADLRRHRSAASRRRWRRAIWRSAQFEQAKARLEELKITLDNTIITSPVDGFVSKRFSDPGAFVGPNSPVVAVVDIRTVRMVANLVEKDMKRVPRRHVGGGRSRRVPRREVLRPRQPRRPGLRSGDAHRGNGDRDPEQQLSPQARDVFARAADGRLRGECADHSAQRAGRARRQAGRLHRRPPAAAPAVRPGGQAPAERAGAAARAAAGSRQRIRSGQPAGT